VDQGREVSFESICLKRDLIEASALVFCFFQILFMLERSLMFRKEGFFRKGFFARCGLLVVIALIIIPIALNDLVRGRLFCRNKSGQ